MNDSHRAVLCIQTYKTAFYTLLCIKGEREKFVRETFAGKVLYIHMNCTYVLCIDKQNKLNACCLTPRFRYIPHSGNTNYPSVTTSEYKGKKVMYEKLKERAMKIVFETTKQSFVQVTCTRAALA